MSASDRFDIVLFGATGFTGQLVLDYLASHPNAPRLAIAGRNHAKLEAVRTAVGRPDLPILVADVSDPTTLGPVVESAKVVCSTVGPYATHGTPLVERVVEAGIGYCDLTGEVHWMRMMIDRFHARAEQTGARVVHAAGFDSIPSDLGVFLAVDTLQRNYGRKTARVEGRFGPMRGSASGGTIASAFGVLEAARDPELRRILGDPYGLNPSDAPRGISRNEPLRPTCDSARGRWSAPFLMAPSNTRIVRRSQALLPELYGPALTYDERVDTGKGASGLLQAAALSAGMIGFGVIGMTPGLRAITKKLLPAPGEGPSKASRESGFFRVRFYAESEGPEPIHLVSTVVGTQDPGYGETRKMLGESALCLALDPLPKRGGILTPASAMGMTLIERLRRAGMTFEVEEIDPTLAH